MPIFRFLPKSRFSQASFAYTLLFISVIIYFELIQIWTNAYSWTLSLPEENEIRILLVADPQLLGEHGELPFIGMFTRWHADRYVAQNYKAAVYRAQPHVVIFLGDLFDEGTAATEVEAARYLYRFQSVFRLGKYSKTNNRIVYIFLPGDNDIGGEGFEEIRRDKIQWFNTSIGDLQSSVFYRKGKLNLKFSQTNFLLPFIDIEREETENGQSPSVHFGLSHYPCMNSYPTCSKVLTSIKPNVILSSHTHKSTYYQYNSEGKILYMIPNLLTPGRDPVIGTSEAAKKMGLDLTAESVRFSLRNIGTVHEIITPTCSYRMGVSNMGFSLLTVDPDGDHIRHQVLWLPNGFKPLYVYIVFYVASKLIFTPWVLWKVLHYCWPKLRRLLGIPNGVKCLSGDKTHLV